MQRLALFVLAVIVASACTSATTTSPSVPSRSGVTLQERPVEEILDPQGGDVELTCRAVCTNEELSAQHIVLGANDGTVYRLGPVVFTQDNISDAKVTSGNFVNGQQTWAVDLALDGTGTQQLAVATHKAVTAPPPQNQLALVLDGGVYVAVTVLAPISSGNVQITTNNQQEAEHIASLLAS